MNDTEPTVANDASRTEFVLQGQIALYLAMIVWVRLDSRGFAPEHALTWAQVPASANQAYAMRHDGRELFGLSVAAAVVLSLQGVFNAVLFAASSPCKAVFQYATRNTQWQVRRRLRRTYGIELGPVRRRERGAFDSHRSLLAPSSLSVAASATSALSVDGLAPAEPRVVPHSSLALPPPAHTRAR